jgi:hypothetical protein
MEKPGALQVSRKEIEDYINEFFKGELDELC